MGSLARTIGLARVRVKISRANLAYKIKHLVWLRGTPAPA
jgi:hypothetical protein